MDILLSIVNGTFQTIALGLQTLSILLVLVLVVVLIQGLPVIKEIITSFAELIREINKGAADEEKKEKPVAEEKSAPNASTPIKMPVLD